VGAEVEELLQGRVDHLVADVDKRLLVAADAVPVHGDAGVGVELHDLRGVLLLAEVDHALELELAQEVEVLLGRVRAAEDPLAHHRKVLGGVELVLHVRLVQPLVPLPRERAVRLAHVGIASLERVRAALVR